MKKSFAKFICTLIIITFSVSLITFPVMATDDISVMLNDVELEFDVPPQLINDRVLVPMRKIFETMGAVVEWEEVTETVTATKDDIVIIMQIDNNIISVSENEIILDVPPQLVNDRTLVPVRAVAEGLNADVDWVETTQTVLITEKFVASPTPAPTLAPTPTKTPISTPSDKLEIGYYEVNDCIPDYLSVTGAKLNNTFEPDNRNRTWQYNYEYNENECKKYIDCLQKVGFVETCSGVSTSDMKTNYYSKGIETFCILISEDQKQLFLNLYETGTAEEVITSKNEKFYKENNDVINFGNLFDVEPIRFDAGYTAYGDEIVLYLYPMFKSKDVYYNYDKALKADSWIMVGIELGAPITKTTYIKDSQIIEVVSDIYLSALTVSFSVTNQEYSKPPANQ